MPELAFCTASIASARMAFAMLTRIAAGTARRGEESFMVARLEQLANLAVSVMPAASTDEVLGGQRHRRA